jgi:hypothetical protein
VHWFGGELTVSKSKLFFRLKILPQGYPSNPTPIGFVSKRSKKKQWAIPQCKSKIWDILLRSCQEEKLHFDKLNEFNEIGFGPFSERTFPVGLTGE